jgi:acyl-CoA hydrolase
MQIAHLVSNGKLRLSIAPEVQISGLKTTMQKRVAKAKAKHISAAGAAAKVKSGMWIDYGASVSQPDVFDAALAMRKSELSDIKLINCIAVRPRAVLEADPNAETFYNLNQHFSGYDRKKGDAGQAGYFPVNLGEVPDYYRRFIVPLDVVILKVCPMDADGNFNLGPSGLWHRAMIERAKMVILEINAHLPFVHGPENFIHVSEVDFIIDGDGQRTSELPNPPPTDVDIAVGKLIAAEVEDGSCLQIGIGGMPNAVCTQLLDSSARDLGIHTEMMTDGLGELYSAGKITNARKQLHPGKVAMTFALGSQRLYDTINRNADMLCLPVDQTNLPHVIMQNKNVVAINNTTQMDLQGQAASESDGLRHISGSGGQLQFVRGAYASEGGKSFICMSSTYNKRGAPRSRIVLSLTQGNIVTTPRTDMMYVVTEYGMVNLKGKSVAERAKLLISIAHPDFREDLERQAFEHRITPRGFTFGPFSG